MPFPVAMLLEMCIPSNTWFLEPTRQPPPNGNMIGSAVEHTSSVTQVPIDRHIWTTERVTRIAA